VRRSESFLLSLEGAAIGYDKVEVRAVGCNGSLNEEMKWKKLSGRRSGPGALL